MYLNASKVQKKKQNHISISWGQETIYMLWNLNLGMQIIEQEFCYRVGS